MAKHYMDYSGLQSFPMLTDNAKGQYAPVGMRPDKNSFFGQWGQIQDPRYGQANYWATRFNQDPGLESLRKYQGGMDAAVMRNPYQFYGSTMDMYNRFMGEQGGDAYRNNMENAYGRLADPRMLALMQRQAMGQTPMMRQMQQQALGRNSVVEQQANAQRQAGMRDIAMQTSMQQGAQYNPALARTAIYQQSAMNQNMAPQIAAAKAQERQAAQMAYMQAMQGAQQGYYQNAGNVYNAANQMYTGAQNAFGALGNQSLQAQAQYGTNINQSENLAKNVR